MKNNELKQQDRSLTSTNNSHFDDCIEKQEKTNEIKSENKAVLDPHPQTFTNTYRTFFIRLYQVSHLQSTHELKIQENVL